MLYAWKSKCLEKILSVLESLVFLGWGETAWKSKCLENIFSFWKVYFSWGWVRLSLPLTGQLYQPRTTDDECGAVGRMKIGRGNRSSRRKPAPMPLCSPQSPHDFTWARTLAGLWDCYWKV
jgi:hypothetical protein